MRKRNAILLLCWHYSHGSSSGPTGSYRRTIGSTTPINRRARASAFRHLLRLSVHFGIRRSRMTSSPLPPHGGTTSSSPSVAPGDGPRNLSFTSTGHYCSSSSLPLPSLVISPLFWRSDSSAIVRNRPETSNYALQRTAGRPAFSRCVTNRLSFLVKRLAMKAF